MIKRLLVVVGVLCFLSPWLAPGIGGIEFTRSTFETLYIVGAITLVGAAVLHQLEKRK